MVSQVTAPRGLETLPARPPTPPREKQQTEADSGSRRTRSRHSIAAQSDLHTPPNHSPDSANTGSRRTAKKVGFSAQPVYREPPTYDDKENGPKQLAPLTAPSSTGSAKLIKSILKPFSVPNPLDPTGDSDSPNRQTNIAAMLESTIKQLAGADRESKLDAYMMLSRALKASNNLPDRIALQDQMGLFTQFIQRDITTKSATGTIDSSLTNHALTLLITFLYFPAIASTLSNDFGVFIIDHCIRSFEDSSVPKDVVRHLMQVVASQNFSPKVMTADRVGRLVAALHNIEGHLKGKSIIMSRIIIYRRLIKQSKPHMVSHSDWLLDLFTDMLSSMKEVRAAAIALGFETTFTIGKEKQLSRKVMEVLQLTVDETTYIQYYVQRLKAMAANKEESVAVPQIWSVIILLLRCPIDKWEFFSPWLEIIQKCFNGGDHHTRLEANYAWNRFVYALYLNEPSFSKTIVTVCQPFISQLKRKNSGKQPEELRRIVLGSVCNLYYYAFRPNSTWAQVEHFWLACVRPIMQKLTTIEDEAKQPEKLTSGTWDNLAQATLILTGLFDSLTPRLWKEDRIAENTLAKPDELPAIDPKWVRRNADKVFAVVEPILGKKFLDIASPESHTHKLWRTLISAVAAAASKEVKVSTDTANFMAYAFSLLLKIWSAGPQQSDGDSSKVFVAATQEFLTVMIDALGLLPFTESRLSMSKRNTFMPVATPSHRPGKGQGLTRTPLQHLFAILATKPPHVPDDSCLLGLYKSVFHPFFAARATHSRLDFANELMRESSMIDEIFPYGAWVFIAEEISEFLESSQAGSESNGFGSKPTVGHEYREIVKHLERGIRSTPNLPWSHWQSLFRLLTTRVTDETGEAGCAIAMIEPLAKTFLDGFSTDNYGSIPTNTWKGGVELIATAKQPRDRQALDAARRRLWGTSAAGSRSASFDPFDGLYRLVNRLLECSYAQSDASIEEIAPSILTEVTAFLARCSRLLVFKSLTNLQPGICVWIQDTNGRHNGKQTTKVSEAVKGLWEKICDLFADPATLEHFQLDTIEPLLCAAFESKHRYIVNTVSTIWNQAFDEVDSIQYPERLKTVLLSIRSYVDVVLPGLDVSSYESEGPKPTWVESQEDFGPSSSFGAGYQNTPQPELPLSSARSTPSGAVNLSLPKRRTLESTPDLARTRSAKRNSTPRLRHDDSQLHFAAIQSSSPTHNAGESQVLTARQKEVRERQRETAALFPDIRSSPEGTRSAQRSRNTTPRVLEPNRADAQVSTPKTEQRLEEYVSSTPTPRRGQLSMKIEGHGMDMTDIPSSPPPDPRRNLLSEMKPRSRSGSILEDFQFSSSPISGSPIPSRQVLPDAHAHAGEAVSSNVQEDDFEKLARKPKNGVAQAANAPVTATAKGPSTHPDGPQTNKRSDRLKAQRLTTPPIAPLLNEAQETPKSDGEVFVDAPTSPINPSPRKLRSGSKRLLDNGTDHNAVPDNERSFAISDDEERSMTRLIVEIDSRKCKPLRGNATGSPEKPDNHRASECITVDTRDSGRSRSKSRKTHRTRSVSPNVLSTPVEDDSSQSSQPTGKRSSKKRKRSDKSRGSTGKKRRHNTVVDAEEDSVPDSQAQTSHVNTSLDDTSLATEFNEDMEMSEVDDASALPALPQQQQLLSQGRESEERGSSNSFDTELESDAIELQLQTEASQERHELESPTMEATTSLLHEDTTGAEGEEDTEMGDTTTLAETAAPSPNPDVTGAGKPGGSSLKKIMSSLQQGLDELRVANLKREEVYKIEDMFMDIKKELYNAESRGRK